MSGRVLLIDSVSTNRIILKVKLSAAYYDVIQASSLDDALAVLPDARPDLIIVNAQSLKEQAAACLACLRPETEAADIPVVLFSERPDDTLRVRALRAGFDDILSLHAQENFVLARLRCLMRRRHDAQNLRTHTQTAQALGFAEAQKDFERAAHICVVSSDRAIAATLRDPLMTLLRHKVTTLDTETLMSAVGSVGRPCEPTELFIVDLRQIMRDDALRLVADLRAAAIMQTCPIVPLVADDAGNLAASLLDMGMSDVLFEQQTPEEFALRISTQLQQKRANDHMRNQIQDSLQAAVTDPLTGLYNRRYAQSYLKGLLTRPDQEQNTFAIMLADLDHFKRINDTYGHAAGDAVLAQVADALNSHLESANMVARIGGEEFLIVLPDTTRFNAHQIAKDLCKTVRSLGHPLPGRSEPVGVTISIGVAVSSASDLTDLPVEARSAALLDQADQALYRSKACGRNTVTLTTRTAA